MPFIHITVASKIAVTAVLSQVQGGIDRLISFASRQLNTAERAHSASWKRWLFCGLSSIFGAIYMDKNSW
jgi:hypothetical protein